MHAKIGKLVERAVARRLSAYEDREDVVQEILTKVFLQIGTLRDPACLEIWTLRVAFNIVNAHLRRNHRKSRLYAPRVPSPLPEIPHEEDWEAKLLASRALAVMRRLPERDRALLTRTFFTPARWIDLARDAACSEATMKRRVRRARARLDRLVRTEPGLEDFQRRTPLRPEPSD